PPAPAVEAVQGTRPNRRTDSPGQGRSAPMPPPRAAGGRQTSGPPLLLLGLVFLGSRLVVLPFQQPASDVGIYARYTWGRRAPAERGVPFYELHAREVERQAEKARTAGTLVAPIDEYKDVEYPPLALALMRLPALWIGGEWGEEGPSDSFE